MTDVRLVDANELLRVIDDEIEYGAEHAATNYQLINKGLKIARKVIKSVPTIDARSVKHGKWIADSAELPSKNYTCSECMNKIQTRYYCWQCYIRYCDNCGAKMNGGNADE